MRSQCKLTTAVSLGLLIITLLISQRVLSQQPPFFHQLTVKQGLSQSIVYSAYQDREGFMWFGTANGLNKYDGYTFQVFQPDPNDPDHSLRHSIIWDILEDKAGRLWVTTLGEGIHQIDKKTGRATAYKTNQSNRDLCYQFCTDRAGDLWVASAAGLNQFNPTTKTWVLWPSPAPDDNEIRSVLEDSRGVLWVGTTKGLYQLDRHTRQFRRIALNTRQPNQTDFVNAIYQDKAGSVWIVAIEQGMYRFDFDTAHQQYTLRPNLYLAGCGVSPNGIAEDGPGMLWVGTHGKGLKRLNTFTGHETTYEHQKDVIGSLSNNSVLAVLNIPAGTLWVGTDNGVNLSSPIARKFEIVQLEADPTFSQVIANRISALCEDQTGLIWVGNSWFVHADGLVRLDRRTNTRRIYQHQPGQPNSLMSNHVTALLEDHSGSIWVGTPEGVHLLNQDKGTFTRYPTEIQVNTIQEDRAGNLWMGGAGGIARLDRQTRQVSYYWRDYLHKVNKLLTSPTGLIWVANSGRGLGQIDPVKRTYRAVKVGRGKPLSNTVDRLSDWDILSIYEDKQGIVWLGTNQGGLNRFDPRTGHCSIVTTRQGLPNNKIAGILGDAAGNLWLATNRGLCRYNPVSKQRRLFDERDNLQDNEFNPAYAQGPNGDLLFGGPNGFNRFHPAQLRDNPIPPVVYLTGLDVFDKPRPLPAKRLELAYDQNFIQLYFVGLSYVLPEKNQYAYQLEGVDKGWVYNGNRRFARYTDLSPGSYLFRVKAANNDGVWTPKVASLLIVIHPPWWQTIWAYAFYGLGLMLSVWGLVHYRSRQLIHKNQVLEEKVAVRTEQVSRQKEEIESQRNHLAHTLTELKATQAQLIQREKLASLGELTAGIAHEIQNPLNFVNNFSEVSTDLINELAGHHNQAKQDPELEQELLTLLKNNLQKINHHGQRASSIVRGMLTHARSNRNSNEQPTDLNLFIQPFLRSAYQHLQAIDPTFSCELMIQLDPDIGVINVMQEEMSRVFTNLFSNAFYAVRQKQRKSQSDYQPLVRVSTQLLQQGIEIQVADNGIGMSAAVQQKIFQPFFTTKPTGEGTGLGLSLAYDIITNSHGGSITAESQEGQGSRFSIILPLKRLQAKQ